jgi:hypothetical protein
MNSAGGSLSPTESDDDFAPKVRSEIGIRGQPSAADHLHRGSLSSINREQRSKAGLALAAASDVQKWGADGSNEK